MTTFKKYWIFSLLGTLAVSFYPLYMGVRVVSDMLTTGTVLKENYPKYIIPYTPIAVAVIIAVALMPVLLKYVKKNSFLLASIFSLIVFFVSELLLESKVIVTATVETTLESWQMMMCYIPPESYETRTWRAVDILICEYSPLFKMHFYTISMILIISILNCLYGFAQIIRLNDRRRCKSLIVQSICTALFLGLCIFACFTAFFRDGELTVSALSAVLMILFFVVLGVTAGTYTGSFFIGRRKYVSILLPSVTASLVTFAMYIGETFLLSGHLYRFGTGFLFDGIAEMVIAPIDAITVVLSGLVTAVLCYCLNREKQDT